MPKKLTHSYVEAIGRRKSAIARTRIYITTGKSKINVGGLEVGSGDLFVNGKVSSEYFPSQVEQLKNLLPLELTDSKSRFAIIIKVLGGGKNGQLEASVLGIARALQKLDETTRPSLKAAGLLTRDSRVRERRKVGTGGRARRKKQSPKR